MPANKKTKQQKTPDYLRTNIKVVVVAVVIVVGIIKIDWVKKKFDPKTIHVQKNFRPKSV